MAGRFLLLCAVAALVLVAYRAGYIPFADKDTAGRRVGASNGNTTDPGVFVREIHEESVEEGGWTLDEALHKARLVSTSKGQRVSGGSSTYELGNLVCQRGTWSCGSGCHQCHNRSHISGTIGCAYFQGVFAHAKPANLSLLSSLIRSYAHRRQLPYRPIGADTLVVHLRLGDGSTLGYIPASFQTEHTLAEDLSRIPRGVTRVVLTGSLNSGNHGDMAKHLNSSVAHVMRVTKMFEERGYLVRQRLSGVSPSEVDADVVFMTRAMHSLCSHGTFSTLIARRTSKSA